MLQLLHHISTRSEAIDKEFDGGIPIGSVSLIYGEAETAKSTLAIQCAVNCATQGYKTLYIDCDGTFSTRRLSQIAQDKTQRVAESIILIRPSSFGEQASTVDHLTDYLTRNFGLVVVDTVTSLYRAEIAEAPEKAFKLNRELNRQLALLAQASKTHKIAVLVVSQVQTAFKKEIVSIEPVATRVLKFWADIILCMKPSGSPQIVRLVIEKPKVKPTAPVYYLKIEELGLHRSIDV